MFGYVPSPSLAFKRDFPGCYNSPSTITVPIQKLCCLQRYATACSESVFQGTQSIKRPAQPMALLVQTLNCPETLSLSHLQAVWAIQSFSAALWIEVCDKAYSCVCSCMPGAFDTKEEYPLPFFQVSHSIQTQTYSFSLQSQWFLGRGAQNVAIQGAALWAKGGSVCDDNGKVEHP